MLLIVVVVVPSSVVVYNYLESSIVGKFCLSYRLSYHTVPKYIYDTLYVSMK